MRVRECLQRSRHTRRCHCLWLLLFVSLWGQCLCYIYCRCPGWLYSKCVRVSLEWPEKNRHDRARSATAICMYVRFSVCLYWKIIMFNKMWSSRKKFLWEKHQVFTFKLRNTASAFFAIAFAYSPACNLFIWKLYYSFFLFLSRVNLLKWKLKDISSGIYRALEQSTMSILWIKYMWVWCSNVLRAPVRMCVCVCASVEREHRKSSVWWCDDNIFYSTILRYI